MLVTGNAAFTIATIIGSLLLVVGDTFICNQCLYTIKCETTESIKQRYYDVKAGSVGTCEKVCCTENRSSRPHIGCGLF